MLSRVADAIYWMSRYLQRAENIARFLDVNWYLTLDSPAVDQEQWTPLLRTTGDFKVYMERYGEINDENVIRFLTFDTSYPSSILSCLGIARDNARSVRDIIPSEMWEQINVFYHLAVDAARHPETVLDNLFDFCGEVKRRDFTIAGIAYDAMARDEAWDFFRMGRLLERADKTSRILDVKYFLLLPDVAQVGSTMDYVQWAAMLKATSGLEAYRHRHGRIQPDDIVQFLLLDRDFPRSALYCLSEAQYCLHAITGTRIGYFSNPAEKRLGQVCAELSYQTVEEIFEKGLHEFTDSLQTKMNTVDEAIFETFFALYPAIDETPAE